MKRLIVLLALASLLIAGSALAQDTTEEATPANAVWEHIEVEGAVCSRGTPYSFFTHTGDPNKLMVYFQGGGACWGASTCKPGGTFDDTVERDDISFYGGIFDFADPENPVADYSIVVVPYCTGDVHTGAAEREFSESGDEFTIAFNGFTNAQAVLDWTYAQYDALSEVIVTGSSAGAYGAIFNAPYVLEHYPNARALVLGDAGMGVFPAEWDGLTLWGTPENLYSGEGYDVVETSVDFANNLYLAAAAAFPDVQFVVYTSDRDFVQAGFYLMQGGAEDWNAIMENSIAALNQLDNFRSYLAWGGTHTILASRLFYQMQVGGVSFRDWFAALVEGEPLPNVQCEDCETTEVVPGH
jgi:hypothetical protein